MLPMCNVKTEYKKNCDAQKTKLSFLCHLKRNVIYFLTRDYIFVAM